VSFDTLHRLAARDPAAIDDDFSAHPADVHGGQPPPLGPIVVHDPHVGVSESTSEVLRDFHLRDLAVERVGADRIEANDLRALLQEGLRERNRARLADVV